MRRRDRRWRDLVNELEDEAEARSVFNPEGHIRVELPSGAVATVAPGCPVETLEALDRLGEAVVRHFGKLEVSDDTG
jgi:hypothetical protein